MAMQTNPEAAQINVTPLIDVLLVLLIIFLIVSPTKSVGLNALLPQDTAAPPQTTETAVVLQVGEDETYRINHQAVAVSDLANRLREVFALRADKVLFVQAAPAMEFAGVARAIDRAKNAGVDRIGLLLQR